MTEKQIRLMIKQIIGEVDYDASKFYEPDLSEDPEAAEQSMKRLVKIVRQWVRK